MEIHLKIIGMLLIALGLAHGIFPRYFEWKTELQQLSLMNRQMMKVHTFFIALVLVLMGMLCIGSAYEIVATDLGRKVAFGFGIFWLARLLIQFFGYSAALWKGKAFETAIHVFSVLLWTYLSVTFLLIANGMSF